MKLFLITLAGSFCGFMLAIVLCVAIALCFKKQQQKKLKGWNKR